MFSRISPAGTAVEELRSGCDLTGEQLNTALWALTEQRKIWREEDDLLRRKKNDSNRIGLGDIHARRKGDYQRLDDVLAYYEETACPRSRILRYFGEPPEQGHRCGNCSSCKGRKSRSKEIIKTTGAKTMTEWHRLRKSETAAAMENGRQCKKQSSKPQHDKVAAYVMAQKFVKDRLVSPSTAKFPWMGDKAVLIKYRGKEEYTVGGF